MKVERTTVHVHVDVAGLLAQGDADLTIHVGGITLRGRPCETVVDLRRALVECLEAGVKCLPVGQPCEGFSYRTGCPGHREGVADAS